MDTLWSPWRSEYIRSFSDVSKGEAPDCFLCDALRASPECDAQNLLLYRTDFCFVIMNRYPYNAGHVMVVPNAHSADFSAMRAEVSGQLIAVMQQATAILSQLYKPHGFNIGLNLGRVAGAGVPDHLHFHIVPRWSGDTNFMPTIGETKVISESLPVGYTELHAAFHKG